MYRVRWRLNETETSPVATDPKTITNLDRIRRRNKRSSSMWFEISAIRKTLTLCDKRFREMANVLLLKPTCEAQLRALYSIVVITAFVFRA